MDVVITQKAFGRISGKKLIKFEPDSECPSFPNTLYVCKDIDVLFEYLNIKMTSPPLYKFWINIQLTVNQVSI